MRRRERTLRLLGLALWAGLVLLVQSAAYAHQEGERRDLLRDYRAQGRPTPAMTSAYRDVAQGSGVSYVFTSVALSVAGGVVALVIAFVLLCDRSRRALPA